MNKQALIDFMETLGANRIGVEGDTYIDFIFHEDSNLMVMFILLNSEDGFSFDGFFRAGEKCIMNAEKLLSNSNISMDIKKKILFNLDFFYSEDL